ncbi:NRPS protein [Claviceps humidiphila]|uniref:NRPS protein n=1 Tax=Claviceps humidiphila TaxID=1294629 RepID=A0A9P7Q8L9_9HYPO|nr:NRPS protein [Claviceps humidiphila]
MATVPVSVCDLIRHHAEAHPEALAISKNEDKITYGELHVASIRIARLLADQGVGRGDVVPLLGSRCLEMIACTLAIFMIGATLVPMEAGSWSEERIQTVLDALEYKTLLVTAKGDVRRRKTIDYHEIRRAMTGEDEWDDGNVIASINGPESVRDVAYIIFTSGTTGNPKGVKIAHQSLLNYVWPAHANAPFNLGVGPSDTSLLLLSVAFDAFYGVLLSTLCNGGHVLLSEPSTFIDDAKKCTLLPATPTLLGTISDVSPYSNVRGIFLGGETPTPDAVRKWWTPSRSMWNAYGPTEATISVTMAELRPDAPIVLGEPIRNSKVIILDSNLEEATQGEICVLGSTVLALGYYKNQAQTDDKFVLWNNERIYRTGDMAKWTQNGLKFLGRKDQLIKNRGFLINLEADVIPAILSQKDVETATALMHRQRLIAFVTPLKVNGDLIRQEMARRFDQFLVPDEIQSRDQLPQTINGKVDNRALHEELVQRDTVDVAFNAPISTADTKLGALMNTMSEALAIPAQMIRPELSFTDVGGNSLLAIKMLSALRQRGLSLSMSSLFLLPTISEISNHIIEFDASVSHDDDDQQGADLARCGKSLSLLPGAIPSAREITMTDVQRGMIRSTLHDSPTGYMLITISLHQTARDINPAGLSHAVSQVLGRHDVFSSSFDLVRGIISINDRYQHDWETRALDGSPMSQVITDESELLNQRARMSDTSNELFRPVNAFRLLLGENSESVLLWLVHHALVDGWSVGKLLNDFRAQLLTENAQAAQQSQFSQYTAALTPHLEKVHETAELFWKESMAGLLDGTELKVGRLEDGASNGSQIEHECLSLGLSLEQTEIAARALGFSPAVIFHAAWALLLSSYASEDAVVFGSVFSARSFHVPRVEEIVGPLINLCPFPVQVHASGSKMDLLSSVQSLLLQISEYQWSASKILQDIASGSHARIFSTALFLEYDLPLYASSDERELAAWTYDRKDWPEFGLTLQVQCVGEHLGFRAVIKDPKYESPLASRLLGHFRNLCLFLLSPKMGTLAEANDSMLGPAEMLCLTRTSTSLFTPYSGPPTLKQAFEIGVATWPMSVALESLSGKLLYQELDSITNALARSIRAFIRPRDVVALLSDGSQNWLLGVLSIIKAGATYLPLDTKLPNQRMEAMMETSGACLCIYPNASSLDAFSDLSKPRFLVYEHTAVKRMDGSSSDRLEDIAEPDDYAYIMFTSGSTGTPKGIRVTHRATMSHLSFEPARLHARPGRRHAQVFSPGFDVNIAEIFGTLCYGATLVLKDPVDPFAHLSRVDAAMITPSFLSILSPTELQNLDSIYLIGEAVSQSLADRWSPGRVLYNFYGPCECTIAVAYARLEIGRPVTLGKTIPRVGCYILDRLLRPVSVGVIGEICLYGVQTMEGYIGRDADEVTKRAFVQDPFRRPGEYMYRTGDLAFWTENMEMRYVGRADHQVKVRGYRIELEEIENMIRRSDDHISQSVAIVHRDTIYAFVTPQGARIDQIQQCLRQHLPSYAVPQLIIALEAFPTTPNQKLDRKALVNLLAPVRSRENETIDHTELVVSQVWREVIGLDEEIALSIDDDFLAIGGNSLRQIAAAQKTCSKLGCRVPLSLFITNRSIRSLAASVKKYLAQQSLASTTSVSLAEFSNQCQFPSSKLSYLEKEFLKMYKQASNPSSFNVVHRVRLQGDVDSLLLERALQTVVSKHDILRASYVEVDGVPQRVIQNNTIQIDRIECSDDVAKLQDYISMKFELSGMLMRIALVVRVGATDIILVQHHIITDQVSVQIFLANLSMEYCALACRDESGQTICTSDNSTNDYHVWALWRDSQLEQPPENANCEFWRSQFGGKTESIRLIQHQKHPAGEFHSVPRRLKRNSSSGSIEVYLAAAALALRNVSGLNTIRLGVPFLDRLEPGTENMMGVFLDALPVCVQMEPHTDMPSLLSTIHTTLTSAIAHAIPSFMIKDIVGLDCIFEVMIVYNRFEDRVTRNMSIPGVSISVEAMRAQGAKFPLLIEFNEHVDHVTLEIEYSEDVLTPTSLTRFEQDICDLLNLQTVAGRAM